ncbi:sterile alpha motif domain-containing protein 15 [Sigmodon hispidus]
MAEVPEDYDSGPDESQTLLPKRTGSRKLLSAKSETVIKITPLLLPESDQEPEEDDFKERKPSKAKNVLQKSARTSQEEIWTPQTELEITQMLKLATGEDLEILLDEKHEEPDLQPPHVSVDVLKEPPTKTNIQLPTETEVPKATSSELPEETGQKFPEQSLREGDKEMSPEQNTPDFPRKSVEEENLPPSEMTEITEERQEESAEEKSIELSEVTKPEFPGQTLRKSTEKTDSKSTEEIQIKPSEQIGSEQPEQIKSKSPDRKPRQSTKEKAPEPLEELILELSEEEPRQPVDEASLELSEKATLEPKETQRREEKVPEPLEDSNETDQKQKLRKSNERSKSKGTLVEESSKEKGPVLQEQTDGEFPKKKLTKSAEETGQVPPQITKPEVQEKSQPEPTKEKNLELTDEPKPGKIDTDFLTEHEPELRKLKYPVDKDELVFLEYHKNMSEKETGKAKDEYMVGSPRESVESAGTDYETHELLKSLHSEIGELLPTVPASESWMESRDSVSEKKGVVLPQELEKMGLKKSKSNKRITSQFEYLKWSPEKVAEWISELGFPQYKECFTANFINGRKLIFVNCCNLPQMGITDFEDMKTISHHVRELLGIEEPLFTRSISLPYRDNVGLFLEQKGHSGVQSDSLTLSKFVKESGLQEYGLEMEGMENEASLTECCQEENETLLEAKTFGKE